MRPVDREVTELQLAAERALRADDWPALIALKDDLRERAVDWWPYLWAPAIALGLEKTGQDGWPDLVAAVEAGFRQPELLPLAEVFDTHPGWDELFRCMHESPPPDRWTLEVCPTVDYGPPLVLDEIAPERATQLRGVLPPAQRSAWDTAVQLLEWTTTRWEHANDHVDDGDAVDVLDGVAAGRRFACVEYSIVLSQALNAMGIPARRVSLRSRDSHVGFGRGHVVSEAWIDDLGKWVVLDGQNGAWWGTRAEPLGYADLHEAFRAGHDRPQMISTARDLAPPDQDLWWRYFDSAISSGLAWDRPYVATFQGQPAPARLVSAPDANVHPDLSQLETTIVDLPTGPGIAFTPVHPYATGVCAGQRDLTGGQSIPLADLMADTTRVDVATVTEYGALAAHDLSLVRPAPRSA